jgi:hypothetical protein
LDVLRVLGLLFGRTFLLEGEEASTDFHVRADECKQNNFTERLRTQLKPVITPAQRHVEMRVFIRRTRHFGKFTP